MIIGAGLAGMIAAYVFPKEAVLEARSRDWVEHQALLRFRSNAVADLTGIPFKRVVVHKGIWYAGWQTPNIAICNRYAQKTIGRVSDRSIWDISTVERWVAPPDLRERLADALEGRISWNTKADIEALSGRGRDPIISTIPLSVMVPLLAIDHIQFNYAPIRTTQLAVPNASAYQTVYFPTPSHPMYRASLTGDQLTCEWAGTAITDSEIRAAASDLGSAFGIAELPERLIAAAKHESHTQAFGKIAPMEESLRRRLILTLTQERHIYSLGRFATWRNILLDDIVHDAAVIKRLLNAEDDYERALGAR